MAQTGAIMNPDKVMSSAAPADSGPDSGVGGHAGLPANWPQIVALLGTVAVLYVAREVFIPLAIAVLLTFALAPLVSIIRRAGVWRTPAVIAVVTAAFIGIAAFSFLVVSQLSELSGQLPTYQANILEKVRSLKDAGAGHGVIAQITEAVERVGREIGRSGDAATGQRDGEGSGPLLVQIYSPEQPIQILTSMISPLIGPLATAIQARVKAEHAYMCCIRTALLSFARGDAPMTAVEFARRNIDPHERPSFSELEGLTRKKAA